MGTDALLSALLRAVAAPPQGGGRVYMVFRSRQRRFTPPIADHAVAARGSRGCASPTGLGLASHISQSGIRICRASDNPMSAPPTRTTPAKTVDSLVSHQDPTSARMAT